MKPLSLAALIIGINLFFVNASTLEDDEHRPRLFERRPLLNNGRAAAEVPVVEKYTCTSVIAIDKIRYSGGKEEGQVRELYALLHVEYAFQHIPNEHCPTNFISDH